jgi:hypothetical protein
LSILEIVQLRSTAQPAETLSERIESSIEGADLESSSVAIYRRNGLETDLAIHIHRNDETGSGGPSDLGLRLAFELRDYGRVDHTLWENLK